MRRLLRCLATTAAAGLLVAAAAPSLALWSDPGASPTPAPSAVAGWLGLTLAPGTLDGDALWQGDADVSRPDPATASGSHYPTVQLAWTEALSQVALQAAQGAAAANGTAAAPSSVTFAVNLTLEALAYQGAHIELTAPDPDAVSAASWLSVLDLHAAVPAAGEDCDAVDFPGTTLATAPVASPTLAGPGWPGDADADGVAEPKAATVTFCVRADFDPARAATFGKAATAWDATGSQADPAFEVPWQVTVVPDPATEPGDVGLTFTALPDPPDPSPSP
jgi:hypothetical protein